MRTRALWALALLMSLLLGGCVTLPETGGVSTRPGQEPVQQGGGSYDYTPSGPRPGSSRLEIVSDFLLAMQASPQSTAIARKFLTDQAKSAWYPEKRTLVYGSRLVTSGPASYTLSMLQTVALDDRGSWLGEVGGGKGVDFHLDLVREHGQWRIANPPDALLIPRTYFESRYQQYFLYFFDPTARILVPEPTYLPRGDQAATVLVRRLLRGPHPGLAGVLRTFIPGGTKYLLSVPISDEGVAEVDLSLQFLHLGAHDRQLALAQLAWTLRQVTGVESMRVTVNGSPLSVHGVGAVRSVASWPEFDPSVQWATQDLFGIRNGHVVAVDPRADDTVAEFGAQEVALRDVAVDLAGVRLAGVTRDGTTVVLAPRGRAGGSPPSADQTDVVFTGGTDLLKPAWDVFGEVWLVDRTRAGAQVTVVGDGVSDRVAAPGIDGKHISDFAVSRDGSRFVAVVSGKSGDHLVISRVVRGPGGRVRGMTHAVDLPLAQGAVDEIRGLAWRSPASLAVLTGPTPDSSQVLIALVDGSAALPDVDSTAEIFRRRADRVVASPSPDASMFLSTKGELFELGADGQWSQATVRRPLLAATFAG